MPDADLQFVFAHGPALKAAGFASSNIVNLACARDGEQRAYALAHAPALGHLECHGELMREVMRAPADEQEFLFNNASALAQLDLDGSSGLLIARRPAQEQAFLLMHGKQLRRSLSFDRSSMVQLLRRPIVDANYILANAERFTATRQQPHRILAEAERARG